MAIRYITMLTNIRWMAYWRNYRPASASIENIFKHGFFEAGKVSPELTNQIRALYQPRTDKVIEQERGAPFVNLMQPKDITPDNPVMKLAFSKDIFDAAHDYFGGHFILDSIQILHSWPTSGKLRESQFWHKDYGDSKSFHAIVYLNDVKDIADGPFVFINKTDTKKIRFSPFVRRIPDDKFKKELNDGEIRHFYGEAGSMVLVDPAVCYHFGSRCQNARMALFVTFNTSMPFVKPQDYVQQNASSIIKTAATLRPDLSRAFIERIVSP